jgi:hypothetical protein
MRPLDPLRLCLLSRVLVSLILVHLLNVRDPPREVVSDLVVSSCDVLDVEVEVLDCQLPPVDFPRRRLIEERQVPMVRAENEVAPLQ